MEVDKYIVLNRFDRSLEPFYIFLPKPPKASLIAGFGMKKREQYFRKPEYPYRLKLLEGKIRGRILDSKDKYTGQRFVYEMWEYLNDNRADYTKEIEYIKRQIYHVHNGYWFFNYGKATYITGDHYAYLTEWTIDDVDEVEYREGDREYFLLLEYISSTREGYGRANQALRTLYGLIRPKHRRDGSTHKALNSLYFNAIKIHGENIGAIQADTGQHASEHYGKLTAAFRNMKFYNKPLWDSPHEEPSGMLKFKAPSYLSHAQSLGNNIEYATTQNRSGFDGRKVSWFLIDEAGKTKGENVEKRWTVQKRTLAKGGDIHGVAIMPSTTAEMEAENGSIFKNLVYDSMFYDRNETTGSTPSGLVTYFNPSCFVLEGFIDKFGFGVVEDPKEEDVWRLKTERRDSNGKLVGARRYIKEKRQAWLDLGTDEAMEKYISEVKLEPLELLESFAGAEGGIGFDVLAIKSRIAEIELMENDNYPPAIRGNLKWKIGDTVLSSEEFIELEYHLTPSITNRAKVIWEPNDDGKFLVSELVKDGNKRIIIDNVWCPDIQDYKTIASADTFSWLKKKETATKRAGFSLGSGAVFKRRSKEDAHRDIKEYRSHNFIMTYLYRTEAIEIYAEDMLMMSVFTNSLMYPENNIQEVERYFINRGFAGYLLYDRDKHGRKREKAGFFAKEGTQDALVKRLKHHSKYHIWREKHKDLLLQMLSFQGVESLTSLDLLVACGGALLGDLALSKYEMEEDMDSYINENNQNNGLFLFDEYKF